MKYHGHCYRIIKGVKYDNYCDLIMGDKENEEAIKEARNKYKSIRRIKHPSGYYQIFVTQPKTNTVDN